MIDITHTHTGDDALKRYVKQSVLSLSIGRLDGTCSWPEEDEHVGVVGGQWSDVVVGDAAVHATVVVLQVVQCQRLALQSSQTQTCTHATANFCTSLSGTTQVSRYQKDKLFWILLKQT